MNSKVVFALLLIGLLCSSSLVEGRSKFRKALKRVGHAVEKVGKKALDDGTVSKIILGTAVGRKRRSIDDVISESVEQSIRNQPIPYAR